MSLCPKCGVEIDDALASCPLCGAALKVDGARLHESMFDPEDREKFTDEERRTIAWEVLSVSTGIAAAVVCLVDLLVEGALSWSLYPISSLVFLWILFTAILRLRGRPALAALLVAVALPLYLLALNRIEGRLSWGPALAVPIALIAEGAAALVVFATKSVQRKGVNVIGFCLLGVSLLCIGVEASITLYFRASIGLHWSTIAATALVPVAGFLFYLHHRVTKKSNLRKLFRL